MEPDDSCGQVLIHIRYYSWGGHPRDRRMWEGIVARGGDGLSEGEGWDYDTRDALVGKCIRYGYAFDVHRHKRDGTIEIVRSS